MSEEISTAEIIRALRCSSSPVVPPNETCLACYYGLTEDWNEGKVTSCDCDRMAQDAADRLERLAAEEAQNHGI